MCLILRFQRTACTFQSCLQTSLIGHRRKCLLELSLSIAQGFTLRLRRQSGPSSPNRFCQCYHWQCICNSNGYWLHFWDWVHRRSLTNSSVCHRWRFCFPRSPCSNHCCHQILSQSQRNSAKGAHKTHMPDSKTVYNCLRPQLIRCFLWLLSQTFSLWRWGTACWARFQSWCSLGSWRILSHHRIVSICLHPRYCFLDEIDLLQSRKALD